MATLTTLTKLLEEQTKQIDNLSAQVGALIHKIQTNETELTNEMQEMQIKFLALCELITTMSEQFDEVSNKLDVKEITELETQEKESEKPRRKWFT